jgi:hypothetical protein
VLTWLSNPLWASARDPRPLTWFTGLTVLILERGYRDSTHSLSFVFLFRSFIFLRSVEIVADEPCGTPSFLPTSLIRWTLNELCTSPGSRSADNRRYAAQCPRCCSARRCSSFLQAVAEVETSNKHVYRGKQWGFACRDKGRDRR